MVEHVHPPSAPARRRSLDDKRSAQKHRRRRGVRPVEGHSAGQSSQRSPLSPCRTLPWARRFGRHYDQLSRRRSGNDHWRWRCDTDNLGIPAGYAIGQCRDGCTPELVKRSADARECRRSIASRPRVVNRDDRDALRHSDSQPGGFCQGAQACIDVGNHYCVRPLVRAQKLPHCFSAVLGAVSQPCDPLFPQWQSGRR